MWNSTREYRVSVLIKGRKPAAEVEHGGVTYIEGREGTNYELELENRSSGRIMFIPSVDGLSVIDGKPAGMNSPGYVVGPHETVRIPGWKVDGRTAAEFVFGAIGKNSTYAEQTGQDPANQGVIGCMIFREKIAYTPRSYDNKKFWSGPSDLPPLELYKHAIRSTPMMGSLAASGTLMNSSTVTLPVGNLSTPTYGGDLIGEACSAPDAGLGTGWGDAVDFKTSKTTFEKENPKVANSVFMIYYDTLSNLRYMGVPVEKFRGSSDGRTRNAFPADSTGATPPPGWSKYKRARRKR